MSLKKIIASANNILDKTNDVMDTANMAMNIANSTLEGVNDVRNHYRYGRDYYYSDEAKADFAKAKKINRRTDFIAGLTVILWIAIIIGTIVLCVTGNDIILQILHL